MSQIKMKKMSILFLCLLLVSFASAIDCWGTFTKDTEIELIQKCPTCSYVNITSITYPNGTVFLNEEMTNTGINFNYTLPDSSQVGRVSYGVIGDKNGADPAMWEDLCIEITPSGSILSTGQGLLYFLFSVGALLLFSFCLYWVFHLPGGNKVTASGEILSVNDLKYLKIFLVPICYVLLMWIFGIMRSIAANFLIIAGPERFFNWAYWIMLSCAYPLTIFGLWIFFITVINDKKILKSLKQGRPFNINEKGR